MFLQKLLPLDVHFSPVVLKSERPTFWRVLSLPRSSELFRRGFFPLGGTVSSNRRSSRSQGMTTSFLFRPLLGV